MAFHAIVMILKRVFSLVNVQSYRSIEYMSGDLSLCIRYVTGEEHHRAILYNCFMRALREKTPAKDVVLTVAPRLRQRLYVRRYLLAFLVEAFDVECLLLRSVSHETVRTVGEHLAYWICTASDGLNLNDLNIICVKGKCLAKKRILLRALLLEVNEQRGIMPLIDFFVGNPNLISIFHTHASAKRILKLSLKDLLRIYESQNK